MYVVEISKGSKEVSKIEKLSLFGLVNLPLITKSDCVLDILDPPFISKDAPRLPQASQDIKLHQCPQFAPHHPHQLCFLHYVD